MAAQPTPPIILIKRRKKGGGTSQSLKWSTPVPPCAASVQIALASEGAQVGVPTWSATTLTSGADSPARPR